MRNMNLSFWKLMERDAPYGAWFKAEREFLSRRIRRDSRILEVGCGDGRVLNYLLGISRELTGIDCNAEAVRDSADRFRQYPTVRIIEAGATNLPFEDGSFDYVTCMQLFHNFGRLKFRALKEMKRVVKPHGSIIISCHNEHALPVRLMEYKKFRVPVKRINRAGKAFFGFEPPANTSEQFSRKELGRIFRKEGLEIRDIREAGIGYVCMVGLCRHPADGK